MGVFGYQLSEFKKNNFNQIRRITEIIQRYKCLLGLSHEFVLSLFLASMAPASIVCRISTTTAFGNSTKADVGIRFLNGANLYIREHKGDFMA